MAGDFVWFDLMTDDPDGAAAFYSAVTGWELEVWEQAAYTMFKASDGATVGGIRQLPREAQEKGAGPHWLPYITVADADAAGERAAELGGELFMAGEDIPGVGRFCIVGDPDGVPIAPFVPENDMSSVHPAPVGHVAWTELMASDRDQSLAFYCGLFGWVGHSQIDMAPMGIYQLFGAPGAERSEGGMMNWSETPAFWTFYVRVTDLDAAVARVTELGGTVTSGIQEVPGGDHVAVCRDPQGASFAIHHHAED
ncbi:MAG: VOC family protein [Deltaproteobacteria bacterium]|nr:VOC family protein [Deltaproteobacteria bacterium]